MPLIIPSKDRLKFLRSIHALLLDYKLTENPKSLVEACAKMASQEDFKIAVSKNPDFKKELETEADLKRFAWAYFYHHLGLRDYVSAALIIWGPETFTPEPHSVQLIWGALLENSLVNVLGAGSLGKCLGPDVPVLKFDGSVVKAKEVLVGDVLMGDDGGPRNVLVTTPGLGQMYRIVPERGEPWTCNDEHILTLICNQTKTCGGSGLPSKIRFKGNVIDVPIKEYLTWSKSKKTCYSLFHVGVEFEEQPVQFDPYIYGAWLGDGSFDFPAIHKPDGPMAQAWVKYFTEQGYRISVGYKDRCPMWCARVRGASGGGTATNPFTEFIRSSRRGDEKTIRPEYLQNSRENRLQLLAGLLDSDGCVEKHAFTISSKYRDLANQISWLARSLGLAATVKKIVKRIKSVGFEGTYWLVYISGAGVSQIPTKAKKAFESSSPKTSTWTGFYAEAIGEGNYNGFVIDGNHRFLLGDFTVTHNTYSASALFLLEWCLDPEWTRVIVASNSEDHVKKNLYADIVRLHQDSALPLPGKIDTESISLDKRTAQGVYVLIIPGGPTSRGKLKGAKVKPRPEHPLFGTSSRLFVILDEAQEIPPNIFDEIPNLFSSMEAGDTDHIKILMAANPKDEWSRYGQNCKPPGGFDKLTATQETWESETGWHCVRLNAMLSENVVQRRKVFPRLITWEGVQKIIKAQGGGDENHPTVWTYVFGMFPRGGTTTSVIKNEHLRRAEGDWIFSSSTNSVAAFDPAFTGDLPAMTTGRVGRAVAWVSFDGIRHELPEARLCIQIDAVGILTRGDTQDLVDDVLSRCLQLGVKPDHFAIDKTGPGRGVHDVMRRQWAQKVGSLENGETVAQIIGVEYAGSPTETKISEEDVQTPKEIYDRICSELWFAAGKLFEYDCIRFGRAVDAKTIEELASRRGGMKVGQGKKQSVESKGDFKARTGSASPDRADSALLMCHAARMTTPGLIPKAKDTKSEAPMPRDAWGNFTLQNENMPMKGYEGHTLVDSLRD